MPLFFLVLSSLNKNVWGNKCKFGTECQQHNITWQLEINKTLWQASPIIPARAKTIFKVVNHAHTLRNSHKKVNRGGLPFFPCPYFTDPRILAFQQTKLCLDILLKNFPCILYATTFGIHVNQATTHKHIRLKTTVNDRIRLNTAVNDPCLWTCFSLPLCCYPNRLTLHLNQHNRQGLTIP
jgi:hypothetical protein